MLKQCVILLGGKGTRLGEVTKWTPKPLLEVGGTPFVETLIAEARRRGFCEFLLLAGHRSEAVSAFVAGREIERRFDCAVTISIEPEPYGTGGAVAHARPLLRDEFLLLNGDTWFDFNWLDLVARARSRNSDACMALREVVKPDRYETIVLDGGVVRAINPRERKVDAAPINGGVYYLTRRAIEGLACPSSLEADLLPDLVRRGVLQGCVYGGFFIDIGVPETLAAAEISVPAQRVRPAAFLDRDGVLNVDRGYVHKPAEFEWMDNARQAVKWLNDAGYYVFVVTNQAGVARGLYDEETVIRLHRWIAGELCEIGASVDDWRYCPYHPEGSVPRYCANHPWRKPSPGMIEDLMAAWPVARERSFMIGDKQSDLDAAKATDLSGHLFGGGDLLRFVQDLTRNCEA